MDRTGRICPQPLSLCGFPKANPRQRGTTGLLPDRCHWMGGTESHIFEGQLDILFRIQNAPVGRPQTCPREGCGRTLFDRREISNHLQSVHGKILSESKPYPSDSSPPHAGRQTNRLSPVLNLSILARSRRSNRFGEAQMTQELRYIKAPALR